MKILLATDGSEFADVAVQETARRPWPEGSTIKVISAYDVITPFVPEAGVLPPDYYAEIEKVAHEKAQGIVNEAAAILRSAISKGNINITTDTFMRRPKDAILEEAESWDADLIIVGSHGYGGIKRFLLGSVSHAVASSAHCSIEIVRKKY